MTSTGAADQYVARRDYIFRRMFGWIVGVGIVAIGCATAWTGVGYLDGHVTVSARPGSVVVQSCKPADPGYTCTGTFEDDATGEKTQGATLATDRDAIPNAALPALKTDDGYTATDDGELTTGKLSRALFWLGLTDLLWLVGAFFLLTGYQPRPPLHYGPFIGVWRERERRFGRVTLEEGWHVVRHERGPALPILVVVAVMCPVLFVGSWLVGGA
ncbi:hypothetical protein ACIRL3_38590 [Streptomyces sp. NPDC102384]|uniref:hypothetical protein n=1 Tax=Streptomyces sp. NPDC102384 TaxID=3366166 RepID=UPI003826F5D6